MRIHVRDLTDKLTLALTGDEDWLARIYGDFPTPPGPHAVKPKISGNLSIDLEEAGTVVVEGRLAFAPLVPCARCDLGIPWPLDLKIRTRFYPEDTGAGPKERTLSRHELDAYYLENDEVDVEQLVNDLVQTAVPAFVDASDEDGPKCPACGDKPAEDEAFEAPKTSGLKSPFEALLGNLKDLKLKQ